MSLLLHSYSQILVQSYRAREARDFELVDDLLSRLDHLWMEMTAEEQDTSKAVARATRQRYKMQQAMVMGWNAHSIGSLARGHKAIAGSFDFKIGKELSAAAQAIKSPVEGWTVPQIAAA